MMDNEPLSARQLTRESRASFGNVHFEGEAANLVAIAVLTFAAMLGSAAIVVASAIAVAASRNPVATGNSNAAPLGTINVQPNAAISTAASLK